MSYLTGPLTRNQIKTLMDPKRADFAGADPATVDAANPMSMPGTAATKAPTVRPVVGAGVTEMFVPPAGSGDDIVYQPHLLRAGVVHFSSSKAGVDGSRTVCLVNPITASGIDWDTQLQPPKVPASGSQPVAGAGFTELPGFAMNAANYKQVEKDFADWLYHNERADIFSCPALKQWSNLDESEGDFRARLDHQAREARDAAIEKLRDAAAKQLTTIGNRLQTAEGQLARQKTESSSAMLQTGVSVLGSILGAFLGRKSSGLGSLTRGTSAIGKATGAYKQHEDVNIANAKVDGIQAEMKAVQDGLEADIAKLAATYDPAALTLQTEPIKPAKSDIQVTTTALLWLPFDARGGQAW
jgi:hypothetical protein